MRFPVILCDPPVPFEVWGKRPGGIDSRAAEAHYPTMTWGDLNNLRDSILSVAADDCVLFLWLCQPLLIETLRMAEAWGFSYKTKAFSWVKTYGDGRGFFVGMGYWTRANTEDVLLFTRGNPSRVDNAVYQVLATLENGYETPAVLAPIARHSQKPTAIHERIERLCGDVPRLEMFARRQRRGWTCVGNEIDGLDIRESLARLAADQPLPVVEALHAEQHSLLDAA